MSDSVVWVEIGNDGRAVRLFKNQKQAMQALCAAVTRMPRSLAVEQIRRKVFVRDEWKCTHCGADVTWDGDNKGHMHERQWRGRGGEISLANSCTLCDNCHRDDPVAGHGKRRPQFHANTKM